MQNVTDRTEAVSEAQPFLLQQHLEASERAEVRVQHEHGQRGELSRAVPAIAAVHHHWRLTRLNSVCDANRTG